MRRNKTKKTRLVVLQLILVLLISVGYAALTTTPKINGSATIKKQIWNVHFENVKVKEGSVEGAKVTEIPTTTGTDTTELTWGVIMDTPGEYYEFNVDVVNGGSLDAMVETATEAIVASSLNDNQKKYLDYTIKYVNGAAIEKNDKLSAGERKTITVKLLFKQIANPEEQTGIRLTYTTNYVLADSTAVDKVTTVAPLYAVGQEVTVGGESFYVIEASDSSKSTVTLLAKYNLNKEGTAQAPNESSKATGCAFSSTNYWATAHAAYQDWSTKKLDINAISGEVSGDAIYKAKQYAKAKEGTNGRLLTYEEANELKVSHSDMIYGKTNQQGVGSSSYFLYYWISSAVENNVSYVWRANGENGLFGTRSYNNAVNIGVRPVIEVSKSLIS